VLAPHKNQNKGLAVQLVSQLLRQLWLGCTQFQFVFPSAYLLPWLGSFT